MNPDERLKPPRTHSRYFVLGRLRSQLEVALQMLPSQEVRSVIDYGCGGMPYRPLVERRWPGVNYRGADLARNPRADLVLGGLGEIDVPSSTCDLVLSTQVLEHVDDPRQYLREVHRVLRLGGFLLLSTHGYWMYHPDPTDYWRWTGDGLRRVIAEAGFDVRATYGVGNLAAAAVQLFQDATIFRMHPRLRSLYALIAQRFAMVLCKLTGGDSTDDAIVFVVVATKR